MTSFVFSFERMTCFCGETILFLLFLLADASLRVVGRWDVLSRTFSFERMTCFCGETILFLLFLLADASLRVVGRWEILSRTTTG